MHVLEIDFRTKILYTSIQCFNLSNICDICGEDMLLYVMVVFILHFYIFCAFTGASMKSPVHGQISNELKILFIHNTEGSKYR